MCFMNSATNALDTAWLCGACLLAFQRGVLLWAFTVSFLTDGGYIQELNESDDSDHEPNGKQDTGSINTESTHPDARSNTESLPRGLGG